MITQLDLYILNNDNSVAPFPSEAEQIVLYDFAFEAQRMGAAPEITATIQANGSLENSLTTKAFCEYNGERYFLKNTPSSSKDNTDPRYTFDLTFVSERTILDNVYMVDAVQGDSNIDRYQSNSINIVFMGTIEECVARLNAAMTYAGVGYSVVLDEGITTESKLVSFQDKFFTEALQEIVNIHNIPYYYVGKVIHFGWSQTTTPTLKYGDGLLGIDKSINSERIVNRATATGSSENIPYYYPNPTPNGFITPIIKNISGAEISVTNESRLGKLSEGSKLRYCEFESPLKIQGYYSSYSALSAGVAIGGNVNFEAHQSPNVIAKAQSLTFIYTKVVLNSDSNTVGTYRLKYEDYISDIWNEVEKIGIYAYRLEKTSSNIGEVDSAILDTSITVSVHGQYIYLNNFPLNQERYIGVVYRNTTANNYSITFIAKTVSTLEDGWYIHSGDIRVEDSPVNISQYGIDIEGTPTDGDEVSYSIIKKIPFATSLMPPIYRESNGERRFYNAVNGAYEGVIFENEYSKENPKEAITTFEDVKPTIVGVTNAYGERIDMFAEFAYDLNDSDETEQTDESSESFIHPYFYAKLHKTNDAEGGNKGFNLFAQATGSGEMTIEMTSGHCGACKFVIAVDENTQRNLVIVDANGNLVYDEATGKVKMASDAIGLDQQNDTQNYEVWIALKKDINTFGAVMPMANSTIKPSINDTFVITNILLPQAYITAAEEKLEGEIIAFLANNNAFQFKYNVNFSRIFLKKRNDVFSLLSENALIPIEYNGKESSFYISSYTYRKQKNDVLPEISVSLTDNFGSTPSAFQQTINRVQTNAGKAVANVEYKTNKLVKKGIAETRTLVNEKIEDFVSISGEQTIRGKKDFVGGLSVNGVPIVYDPIKKAWEFKGDFVVTGAITMFGSLSGFQPSTVTEAVEVDNATIVKTKNSQGQLQLTAIGGGSGTGGGISAAEVNILIENALKPYIKIETADDKYALISTVSGINSRLSAVETFFATEDSDTLINKWSEIVAFLNATEGDTLDNILATKANQSALDAAVASLTAEIGKKWTQNDAKISNWDSAYGWGNHANAGYAAKTYVDAELAKYVKLATAQSIEAQHNFVDGLQIGGLPITKSASANNTIYLDANLVVSGAITMFGSGSTTFPTIWANIPFNPEHMSWDGSQWNIAGGGGSGSLDTNAVNALIYDYLTLNRYATISDISSALVGYATEQWVANKGYLTSSALAGYTTERWVTDNYLANTGGIINSNEYVPLTIRNTYLTGVWVGFEDSVGTSYIGSSHGVPSIYLGSGSNNTILHSGNYSDFALPLTGGTLSGGQRNLLDLNSDSAYGPILLFQVSGTEVASVGCIPLNASSNYGAFLNNMSANFGLLLGNDRKAYLTLDPENLTKNYEIIHSGNIDEYKAGDSDKLGGVYYYQYARIRQNEAINADDTADELSGGKLYGGINWPYAYYAFITSGAGNYKMQFNGYANELKYRAGDESGLSNKNWRTVAFTDSNVASATKLQTPRTIWGQSFDGTSDINGDIHFSAGGNYKIGTPYAVGHEVLYNYITFGAAENGIEYVSGKWTSSGDLVAHRFATQHSDHAIDIFNNGNVAIGGTTADAKLHVHGDIKTTSLIADYVMSSNSTTDGYYVGLASSSAPPYKGLLLYTYGGTPISMYTGATMRMAIGAEGDVTIYGNLLTTGVITMFSQASLKNEVDRFGLTLEQLSMIEPVRFTWKDNRDSLVHAGGIADEVMRVLPEVVHRTKDDKLTMDYGSAGFFIATSLIKPVIDHERRIADLERENAELRQKVERLSA